LPSERTAMHSSLMDEKIECPLCSGEGKLKRTEILDRLGVKDFARVAQLSAEEAFRLLLEKHKDDQRNISLHVESEVQRVRLGLEDKLRFEQSQKEHLTRRVEDYFREISQLRERNQQLETEMAKAARIGKREEMDFAEEARTWPGMCISDKLGKNGDYLLSFRDAGGAQLEPRMLIDNKNKLIIAEADLDKLIRDAKERSTPVAILVTRDESQLRQLDRELRWTQREGVWVLRTTRQWLPRDLEVLRPLFERMHIEGSGFLSKNVALATDVRRSLSDLDAIESELKKASKAILSVSALVVKHRAQIQALCDQASAPKVPHKPEPAHGGQKGLAG
jgi:hypothetical protein